MRSTYEWRLRSRTLALGSRTLIMGVLNVTPDSFADGGQFFTRERAVEHGLEMLAEGAGIIDVGGESTRPGAQVSPGEKPHPSPAPSPSHSGSGSEWGTAAVTAEEELRRVLPVIEGIRRAAPDAVLSVDTYKAAVARAAIAAGAEIVNDVSALRWDAAMAPLVAEMECGLVLMHMRGRPEQWRTLPPLGSAVIEVVGRELGEQAAAAEQAGVSGDSIVLDPGIGFGKNFEENYPLLAQLGEFERLGYPLLVGPSRKSFIGKTISRTGEPAPPERRLYGTLAAVTAAILNGAHIVRVHDVAAAREAAAVADEILAVQG